MSITLPGGLRERLFVGDEAPWLIMSDWLLEQGGTDDEYMMYQNPFITNSIGMRLNLVPRGTFWISDNGVNAHRRVDMPYDYYLGAYEVTQEEYQKVMGNNPSWFSSTQPEAESVRGLDTRRFPVERVSWFDAVEFCQRLSELPEEKKAGRVYRLPTEAEWEYACREARESKEECSFDYYLSAGPTNQLTAADANFDGLYPNLTQSSPYLSRTCPVGSYRPNRLGLYDMHGNVWEWCSEEDEHSSDPTQIAGSAAGAGSASAGAAGPRSATGTCRSPGSGTSGSAWPQEGDNEEGENSSDPPLGACSAAGAGSTSAGAAGPRAATGTCRGSGTGASGSEYSQAGSTEGDKLNVAPWRVLRGGCWTDYGWYCRSAYRYWSVPENRFLIFGFRLAARRTCRTIFGEKT